MAKLAIEGHSTQGSEVIALLEMLGGENTFNLNGSETNCYYYIDNNNRIYPCLGIDPRNYIYYTLEEFLKKFPYKVGDKVTLDKFPCTIKGMFWDCDDVIYYVQGVDFSKGVYSKDKDLQPYKEETMEERHYKELRMPLDDDDKLATEVTIDGNKILPPNGYLIGKITQMDNGMLVEYVKQKPQYPKTYEECFNICFGNKHHIVQVVGLDDLGDNKELFESFIKLKICRDAYWKIAGDWEPEFRFGKKKYCIMTKDNKVISATVEETNRILAFPTEEMRDAFYENFKDLINETKELL